MAVQTTPISAARNCGETAVFIEIWLRGCQRPVRGRVARALGAAN
jgi:hypothetical protein